MLCARSAQKFCGKENNKNNMKRINGVRVAYDVFLLCALHVVVGGAADFNTSKEAYPWPLIVLRHVWLVSPKHANTLR